MHRLIRTQHQSGEHRSSRAAQQFFGQGSHVLNLASNVANLRT
jgi:hypothetical protein